MSDYFGLYTIALIAFILCCETIFVNSSSINATTGQWNDDSDQVLYQRLVEFYAQGVQSSSSIASRFHTPCFNQMKVFNSSNPIIEQQRELVLRYFQRSQHLRLHEIYKNPSKILPLYKLHICTISEVASTELNGLYVRLIETPLDYVDNYVPTKRDRDEYQRPYYKGLFLLRSSPQEIIDIITDKTWLHIAFVRNPYTRLLAGYLRYYVSHESIPRDIVVPGAHKNISFEGFIGCLEKAGTSHNGVMQLVDIFRGQVFMCGFNGLNYDLIGQYETLERDVRCMAKNRGFESALNFGWGEYGNSTVFDKINEESQNITELLRTYYSKDLQNRVYNLYKLDFEAFGYPYDLPQ